jgi:hypothetical protein
LARFNREVDILEHRPVIRVAEPHVRTRCGRRGAAPVGRWRSCTAPSIAMISPTRSNAIAAFDSVSVI